MKKDKFITELKEIVQSSNVNFLFGAGVSTPFLPILNNIETDINNAIKKEDKDAQIKGYKKYISDVMLPNKKIFDGGFSKKEEENFLKTKNNYENFLKVIAKLISERESTILNKQVNIFTTNIDPFFEKTLENLFIDYNDGFSGRMSPTFSLSNFKKSTYQRSLHFDHKSEIPVFNVFKIHGSLTWVYENNSNSKDNKIKLSSTLGHFDKTLLLEDGEKFINKYKERILVVNPENAKFAETVLNKYYYELLRSYSSELERENSVLFVIGFSMEDQHIREITQRAAKSNPTLRIFIFLRSKFKEVDGTEFESRSLMEKKMEIEKYQNISIVVPEYEDKKDEYFYNLNTLTDSIFCKINLKNKKESGETHE